MIISPGDIIEEDDLLSNLSSNNSWLQSIDAILLLGGGVPLSPTEPPIYVQRRCDVVAQIMDKITTMQDHDSDQQQQHHQTQQRSTLPSVICLSAGTAHLPQYIIPHNGLPLWESTASAAYLLRHAHYPLSADRVFAETTSFDTISNAYFARTSFTDVTGWRKILVVTNEFHVGRSKAIFDWIFRVPATTTTSPYEMYYLSCNNVGLSTEALQSRKSHEKRGEGNVRALAERYTSLKGVWEFLTEKHDFYAANKLVATAMGEGGKGADNLLKLSYGKSSSRGINGVGDGDGVGVVGGVKKMIEYKDGRIELSIGVVFVIAFLVVMLGIRLSSGNQRVLRTNPFRDLFCR